MNKQIQIGMIIAVAGSTIIVSLCLANPKVVRPHHPSTKLLSPAVKRKAAIAAPLNIPMRPILQPIQITTRIRSFSPELQARDDKYEQLLEEGDKVLAADPALAEGYYQKASALIAYRPDAWLGLARARDAQGKSTQALPAYRQAFNPPSGSGLYSSFPSDVASLARYGTLCAENGQQEEAMKIYHQAGDRLNPKPDVPLEATDLPAQNLRARLDMVRGIALAEAKEHSGQDRDKESLQAFQKAAKEQPEDSQVQFYLGYGLRKAGQFAEAQMAFQKAARLDMEGTVKAATEENLRGVQAHQK